MATIYTHISANKQKSAFLLIVFIVFVIGLGWAADQLTESGSGFILLAFPLALGMSFVGYFTGDALVLWTSGAKPVTREQNPYVYRLVENLCITAGLPVPKIYLIQDAAPNAFAVGRDPRHASIALTTGLIDRLENEELEAVIAHELSHIGNFDIRFMMLISILVGSVALFADMFWRTSLWQGGSGDRRRAGGLLALIGLLFILLSPIIAQVIQLAVSRRREFLADASGALLTRYPEGLISALQKIDAASASLKHVSAATAHLYFASPFGSAGRNLSRLFSTHPPIQERIRALESMALPSP